MLLTMMVMEKGISGKTKLMHSPPQPTISQKMVGKRGNPGAMKSDFQRNSIAALKASTRAEPSLNGRNWGFPE